MGKKITSLILTLCMLLTMLPTATWAAEAQAEDMVTLDISAGSIAITDDGWKQATTDEELETASATDLEGKTVVITGSYDYANDSGDYFIRVSGSTTKKITISNLTLKHNTAIDTASIAKPAILLEMGAVAELTLVGTNNLTGMNQTPAVQVSKGATLTIMGNGTLNAESTNHGAVIGAPRSSLYVGGLNENRMGGNLIIKSGIINTTTYGGAGLGGSRDAGFGDITIDGGVITTKGGQSIMTVDGLTKAGGEGNITITGGVLDLNAPIYAAGNLTITGGTLKAMTGQPPLLRSTNGDVSITGGNINGYYDYGVDGRVLTNLYFKNSDGTAYTDEVSITEGSHTWTALPGDDGRVCTYFDEDTQTINVAYDDKTVNGLDIKAHNYNVQLGVECTCGTGVAGSLVLSQPASVQLPGIDRTISLVATYTKAEGCPAGDGFHNEYSQFTYDLSVTVGDEEQNDVSAFATVDGNELTLKYRADIPYYQVTITAECGPNGAIKAESVTVSANSFAAHGNVVDIADGTLILMKDGYKQVKDGELENAVALTSWDDENHEITVLGEYVAANQTYHPHFILVRGGNPTIYLTDVTIDQRDAVTGGTASPGILLMAEQEATLNLTGVNNMYGANGAPGVRINRDATLTIEGTGTLNAFGNNNNPGIGAPRFNGDYGTAADIHGGNLVINSGVVNATSGANQGGAYGGTAAIGNSHGSYFGDVTINGGTVTAQGFSNGHGINTYGEVTITGGSLSARGVGAASYAVIAKEGFTISGGQLVNFTTGSNNKDGENKPVYVSVGEDAAITVLGGITNGFVPAPEKGTVEHKITLSDGAAEAGVMVDYAEAVSNTTITIDCSGIPEGKIVSKVTVTKESGGTVEVFRNGSKYAFLMPEDNVTVDVTLVEFAVYYHSTDKETTKILPQHIYKNGQNLEYLLLPASADYTALDLVVPNGYKVSGDLKGVEIVGDGNPTTKMDLTTLFEGSLADGVEYTITVTAPDGGASMEYHVMKSANISSVHITLAEDPAELGYDSILDYIHANKSNSASGSFAMMDEDGTVLFDTTLKKFKGRGNSTWAGSGDKKPYNITLDAKQELIDGAGAAKKWCLLSHNVADKTGAATLMGFGLYEAIGGDSALKAENVDLYVNGEYRGTYVMTEAVEIDAARIAITAPKYETEDEVSRTLVTSTGTTTAELNTSNGTYTLNPSRTETPTDDPALTAGIQLYSYATDSAVTTEGGIVIEIDHKGANEAGRFTTKQGVMFTLKEPEYPTQEQVQKIAIFVQEFEDALYSNTGYNAKGKHYSEYVDLASMAKLYAALSICNNGDMFWGSTYFYMDTNGTKLTSGPAWDFDLWSHLENPKLLHGNVQSGVWIGQLLTKGDFVAELGKLYQGKVKEKFTSMLNEDIPAYLEKVTASYAMNDIVVPNSYFSTNEGYLLQRSPARLTGLYGESGYLTNKNLLGVTVEVLSDGTLEANVTGTATGYQWYKVDAIDKTEATLVENATSATFKPTEQGEYFVMVTGGNFAFTTPTATLSNTILNNETITMSSAPVEACTVTFNANGHGENVTVNVARGTAVAKPEDLSAEGYTFGGWYTESACTNEWNFTTAVDEDMTLYAKWTEDDYTVTLNANYGDANGTTVAATYLAALPTFTALTREGHALNGYFTAAEGGVKVINADGTLVANVDGYTNADGKWARAEGATLYAQWTANTYTISFNSNGGTGEMDPQTATYGVDFTLPECSFDAPALKKFKCWAVDSANGTQINTETSRFSADTTLYAIWEDDAEAILAKAKADAKTELEGYANAEDYREAEQAILAEAIADGKTAIDAATTPEAVTTALNEAKAVIDDIKTDAEYDAEEATALANAKTAAKTELDGYANAEDYREAEQAILAEAIADGKTAIDAATTPEAVTTALNEAKAVIDDIKTDAEYDAEEAIPTPKPPYSGYYPSYTPTVTPSVDSSSLNNAAQAVGSAINSGNAEMKPASGYTKEDIAKLQKEGKLNLTIEKKSGYASVADKNLIDNAITKAGGAVSDSVMYFDITVVLKHTDTGAKVAEVSDTVKAISITVDLNDALQKAAKDGKFLYAVRCHEGVTTFLETKLNAAKTAITFESSDFSTYAVVAMNKAVALSTTPADDVVTPEPEKPADKPAVDEPIVDEPVVDEPVVDEAPADDAESSGGNVGLWIGIGIVALAAIVVALAVMAARKKRRAE